MVARTIPAKTILVLSTATLAACGSSGDSSGPSNTNTGPQAFAPTRDTSLTGSIQVTTFSVPAGVTVTATGPLVINASAGVQIAGTLSAPCFPLSVLGAKSVTITGTVTTSCAVASLPATPPTLLILGDSGYSLQGAKIVASGPLTITTDTTLTDAGFPQSTQIDLSKTRAGSSSSTTTQQALGICAVGSNTFIADPPAANNGADGTPVGQNGQDGSPWALSCTGEMDIQGVITVTGQNGGNGGKGTSTTGATAVGGNGGKGGTLRVRAAGDLIISGGATFTSGSGGDGGAGDAHPSAQGTAATAQGGKGGDVTGSSGTNGPVDVRAKGAITIQAATSIVVGHSGNGGLATASGADGAPGQTGSAATATGGNGGNTSPYGLGGSNVSGIGNVRVSGGNAGFGGKATAAAGNGGATGGSGGPNAAIGGNGGNAQTKDQNGALIGTGGDAGSIEIQKANGAIGADGCPAAGQAGGGGGSASGHPGTIGTGATPGKAGSTLLNNTGNGANGGKGNAPGAGGPAGSDGTPQPKTSQGLNFTPGQKGATCPAPASILTLVNSDPSNAPWDSVQFSSNGGTPTNATKSGTTYTMDITNVAATAIVRVSLYFTSGTTKHIVVFDGPAAWWLAMASNPNCAAGGSSISRLQSAPASCPLPIATNFWGAPNGKVTFNEAGLTGQATVRVGNSVATANATLPTGTLNALLGVPMPISQAVMSPTTGLTTGVSAAVATLTNNQDISALLTPTVAPQNTGITIPAGSIGGPTLTTHGVDALDYRIVPRLTVLDHWKLYDVAYFSKQNATPTSFGFPMIPAANMPSNGLQWEETTMFMTPTTYLAEVGHARSFGPTHAVTFASSYIQPNVTAQTGPSGTTFTISGQLAPGYMSGEFHSSTTLPSGVVVIDSYNYQGTSGPFNIVLPPIPSGGQGPYVYEAGTNDFMSLGTDGGVYWRAGLKGYVGTPPTQTLSGNGPSGSVSVVHGGGCTNASIGVTTTGLTAVTFGGFTQTAGAAGSVSVSPANVVVQPGTGSTPVFHGVPITICSSPTSTGGATAIITVSLASLGLASLVEASFTIQIVIT